MADVTNHRRILLVDGDRRGLERLASCLAKCLPGNALVRRAGSLQEAGVWTNMESFDAAVMADFLPDGRGSDLLRRLASQHGQSIALFLLGAQNPDESRICELLHEHPDVHYIEKPFRPEDLAEQVRHLLYPPSVKEQTFYGLRLFDLIQAYSLAQKSATFRVLLPDGRLGMLGIRKGFLVHAAIDDLEGMEALLKIAQNRKGEIRVEKGCTTAKETIHLPTPRVLIEVYRKVDEKTFETQAEEKAVDHDSQIDTLFDTVFDKD